MVIAQLSDSLDTPSMADLDIRPECGACQPMQSQHSMLSLPTAKNDTLIVEAILSCIG
jgi:hypothetical protein